jgi:hypothetical protein
MAEQHRTRVDGAGEIDDRRLATIRSLLAKAEATEFPEEAEAFFNKASELIARYAIDEAMIWATGTIRREQPDELRLVVHAPYLAQKAVLVSAVAQAHGCRAIRFGPRSAPDGEIVAVIGFPTDLRWVATLVTSLLVQLTSAMLARCPRGLSSAQSASWRRSFIIGFADEVAARLQVDREMAARDADAACADQRRGNQGEHSVSLVLLERSEEVRNEFRRRFPHTRTARASVGTSRAGHTAGREAGRDAALTRDAVGGPRPLPRGR